jgi:tetratricopeptide (TPR) repeat protein
MSSLLSTEPPEPIGIASLFAPSAFSAFSAVEPSCPPFAHRCRKDTIDDGLVQYLSDLAVLDHQLGQLLQLRGEHDAALLALSWARADLERCLDRAEGRSDQGILRALIAVEMDTAATQRARGDIDGALAAYADCRRRVSVLAARRDGREWLEVLATLELEEGALRLVRGDLLRARECYDRAREQLQKLAEEEGWSWKPVLARRDADMARRLLAHGRLDLALELLEQALAAYEELIEKGELDLVLPLGELSLEFGKSLAACGRDREAIGVLQRAVGVLEPRAKQGRGRRQSGLLLDLLLRLGEAQARAGEGPEAIQSLLRARGLLIETAPLKRDDLSRQRKLARIELDLAQLYREKGMEEEALKYVVLAQRRQLELLEHAGDPEPAGSVLQALLIETALRRTLPGAAPPRAIQALTERTLRIAQMLISSGKSAALDEQDRVNLTLLLCQASAFEHCDPLIRQSLQRLLKELGREPG